jgi:hypothetical protein
MLDIVCNHAAYSRDCATASKSSHEKPARLAQYACVSGCIQCGIGLRGLRTCQQESVRTKTNSITLSDPANAVKTSAPPGRSPRIVSGHATSHIHPTCQPSDVLNDQGISCDVYMCTHAHDAMHWPCLLCWAIRALVNPECSTKWCSTSTRCVDMTLSRPKSLQGDCALTAVLYFQSESSGT